MIFTKRQSNGHCDAALWAMKFCDLLKQAEAEVKKLQDEANKLRQQADKLKNEANQKRSKSPDEAAKLEAEAGVPYVHVDFRSWDFHGGGGTYRKAENNIRDLGRVYSALVEDLDDRGLLDSTIVLSGGEMGRSPKPESTVGSRGHWNDAQSFVLAGGGFTRGNIVGATDKIGAFVTDNHYPACSLTRTIYKQLGIDPDHEFYVANRPLRIVPEDGPIIREALA